MSDEINPVLAHFEPGLTILGLITYGLGVHHIWGLKFAGMLALTHDPMIVVFAKIFLSIMFPIPLLIGTFKLMALPFMWLF